MLIHWNQEIGGILMNKSHSFKKKFSKKRFSMLNLELYKSILVPSDVLIKVSGRMFIYDKQ